MKIVTVEWPDRSVGVGLVSQNRVLNVARACERPEFWTEPAPILPTSLRDLLDLGKPAIEDLTRVAELLETVDDSDNSTIMSLDEVRLLPPVLLPDKIIGVGLNYPSHAGESGKSLPAAPMLFGMFRNSLAGAHDNIVLPRCSSSVDYEGELGVVIGRRARYIAAEDAYQYVAGYMVVNDVTARDYQRATSQYTAGKVFDTFAPCGPWLTTHDEVVDPHALRLETKINGELLQSASTAEMFFHIPQLIEFLSEIMTLEPGDIIASGTPAGVGARRDPPRWILDGDLVEVSIEKLGRIANRAVQSPVVAEPAS